MKYDFAAIEKKWQDRWEECKPYAAKTGSSNSAHRTMDTKRFIFIIFSS